MKKLILASTIVALTPLVAPAFAADHGAMQGHAHGAAGQMEQMPVQAMNDGEIKKINTDKGMMTIKHGPLKSLGMGPMTMSFNVADPAMLKAHQPGQKVRFVAENVDGKLTVTHIEAEK